MFIVNIWNINDGDWEYVKVVLMLVSLFDLYLFIVVVVLNGNFFDEID